MSGRPAKPLVAFGRCLVANQLLVAIVQQPRRLAHDATVVDALLLHKAQDHDVRIVDAGGLLKAPARLAQHAFHTGDQRVQRAGVQLDLTLAGGRDKVPDIKLMRERVFQATALAKALWEAARADLHLSHKLVGQAPCVGGKAHFAKPLLAGHRQRVIQRVPRCCCNVATCALHRLIQRQQLAKARIQLHIHRQVALVG